MTITVEHLLEALDTLAPNKMLWTGTTAAYW